MRVVVLATGPAGLRCGAWLASHGIVVRLLACVGARLDRLAAPWSSSHPDLHRIWPAPEAARLTRRLDSAGMPASRSGLVAASGRSRLRAKMERARARMVGIEDGRDWIRANLCGGAPLGDYLVRRYDGDVSPGVARWTHGRSTTRSFRPGGDPVSFQIEQILSVGGDVIDDVEVCALEEEDGRIVSVETDVGREWVDRLYVDMPIDAIAHLLGEQVPLVRWVETWEAMGGEAAEADVIHHLNGVAWCTRRSSSGGRVALVTGKLPGRGALGSSLGWEVRETVSCGRAPTQTEPLPVVGTLLRKGVVPVGPLGTGRLLSVAQELDWLGGRAPGTPSGLAEVPHLFADDTISG